MAQDYRMADDIPLIEEQVETGLKPLLESYRSPHAPANEKKDDLNKRFTLHADQRLPTFDHEYAKAYQAYDESSPQRNVYAMVCEKSLPYRDVAVQNMLGINKPSIVPLLGAGVVNCSFANESRYVMFFERPAGTRLSDSLKGQPRLHEHRIVDYVIQPMVQALTALREKKTSHGNICTSSLYASDSPTVAECYSAPSGTMAHYLYHPLERVMCSPLAFGEANEKTDAYALGILAYELMFGLDKIKSVPKKDYIRMMMNFGSYQLLTNNRSLSEAFQDFFRGVFNDNPVERWGIEQLSQWLNGKRFNMIAPVMLKEAARPIVFQGESFTNRRLFANSLHTSWRETVKEIRALKVDRWCENSLHRPEMAERMERVLRISGEAGTEKQTNDMIARILAILDPTAPLRSMSISVRPDGIGIMLADMIRQTDPVDLYQVTDMIETDVSTFWADLSEANKYGDMAQALWRLQRAKAYLRKKSLGFGLERVLYELNPYMPCQMPLLERYHLNTAQDVLKALDALAPNLAANTSFLDLHLAAFIACKIDMGKELRMSDLVSVVQFERHEELIVLRILAKAQQKHNVFPLVGLCAWAAMRVDLILDDIHNRALRKKLKLQLKKLALTGKISEVLLPILDRDVTEGDTNGFAKAIALHQITYQKIERFKNPRLIEYYARELGGRLATMISYAVLVVTSYIAISNVSGF